ncbi:hypothetical protein SYNPS1DRAFT_25741 [Syncephalis pseudoplumigaleata]|uniref:Uncharacterized protein n=1 Tax=Syncephalis pseudoplumigaleata TaxID=1712513 RepID=A0A4P9YS28_9FUNG|nr:hypothetical protein SYNPS1DRAFT_25741 [Syncephalis pseudoplumigaleata]|eukprot:RKP22495.1 hypothetical protein SYNPS1DRAFT_25741 [Syncephalis pseudoplumigaleata]
MGFGKLALNAARADAAKVYQDTSSQSSEAQSRFGSQKAISSDEFFNRGSYDAQQREDARSKIREFSGATAISSDQWFGREKETPSSPDGNVNIDSAKDFARRFIDQAGADYDALKSVVQSGSAKFYLLLQG